MKTVVFLFITFVIFFTHYLIAYKWMKPRGRSMTEVLLGGTLSALYQIIVVTVVFGYVIRSLHVPELFWSNLVLCLLLLAVTRFRPRDVRLFVYDVFQWMFSGLGIIRKDAVLFTLSIMFSLLFVWLLFLAIVFPPYAWDSLVFHLVYPGHWLQDGMMGGDPGYPQMDVYPRNISVIYFWELLFLRIDTFINCTSLLLFVPLGVFSIYLISRHSGRRKSSSILAGMLFLTLPIVIHQSTTCYVDLPSSCIFLVSLAFLLRPKIEFSDVVYGALGLGIFLGSKGNAPYYIIGAIAVVVVYHLPHLWGRIGLRRTAGWVLIGIFLVMLAGLWSFTESWVKYGNPAHPYAIKLLGKEIFPGIDLSSMIERKEIWKEHYNEIQNSSTLERIYYSWSEPGKRYVFDVRVGGFGPLLFVFLLPALGASLVISLLRRDGRTFFTLAVILVAFWMFPQGRFWTRYSIFVAAAFCIAVVYLIDLLRYSSASVLIRGLIVPLAVISVFLGASHDRMGSGQSEHLKYLLSKPVKDWHSSQYTCGGYEAWVFKEITKMAKPGSVIAYDRTFLYSFVYPLWNRDFSNKTVFIHDDNKQTWLREIEEESPDVIVIGTEGETYKWATAENSRFKVMIKGNRLCLFEVLSGDEER